MPDPVLSNFHIAFLIITMLVVLQSHSINKRSEAFTIGKSFCLTSYSNQVSELDRDPVLSPKQSECTSFEVPSQRRERQRPGKLGRLKCKGEGMGRKVEHELQN